MKGVSVAIINSGGANIASLRFAMDRLGASCRLTTDPAAIRDASHVILPGVGAAADAMQRLRDCGLDAIIPELTQPVLGICLGMQLLAAGSDEGPADCLGVVPGAARRIPSSTQTPVPHMGWSRVTPVAQHALLDGIEPGSYFYFLHSYALPVAACTVATADHGVPFTAILAHRNFVGTQFHPERSAAAGARLLSNFLALQP